MSSNSNQMISWIFRNSFLLIMPLTVFSECIFDNPRTDGINWAYNRGGCFICEETTEGEWLTNETLKQACEQTCTADANCIAYEVSAAPLDEFSIYRGSGNCCLEYDQANASNPLYVQRGMEDNCQKEANCWSRVEKDTDQVCNITEPHPQCRQIYEWSDNDYDALVELVNQGCPWIDPEGTATYQSLLETASETCQSNNDATDTASPTNTPTAIDTSSGEFCGVFIIPFVCVLLVALYQTL